MKNERLRAVGERHGTKQTQQQLSDRSVSKRGVVTESKADRSRGTKRRPSKSDGSSVWNGTY